MLTHGRKRIVFVVLVLLAMAFIDADPAVAATAQSVSTCDNLTNHQVGQSTASGSTNYRIEGASADVKNGGNWAFCSGDTTFSTIWVMAQSNNGSYAQAGLYFPSNGSCALHWAEMLEPGFNQRDLFYGGCTSTGQAFHFWDQVAPTTNGGRMLANTSTHTILTSYNDPNYQWGTIQATFNSETYNYGTNITGSSSFHATQTGMQVEAYSNDTWASTCGNVSLGHSPQPDMQTYYLSKACNAEETWTQR